MSTSTESDEDVTIDGQDESTTDSDENQTGSVEDNSHGEAKKSNSNFKKLSNAKKALEKNLKNPAFLKARLAELAAQEEEGDDEQEEEETEDEGIPFSTPKHEIWFIKNPDAEEYKEAMSDLIDEHPAYAKLPLSDLYVLAKDKYPKSSSKKSIDVSRGKQNPSSKTKAPSEYTDAEIENMSLEEYGVVFLGRKPAKK